MRNLRIILSVAVLTLLACACLPDVEFHLQPQENLLTATIGGNPATKTSLSTEEDNYSKVLWSKGDQLGVFVDGVPNLYTYTLVSGAGRSEAVFSGFGTGASYIAVYPCTAVTGLNGETLSVDLPSEQAYTKGSFGSGSNPMVAVSNTTDLPFRNLCAVLKVSMTGHHNVTSLVFRPNDKNVKVAGPATISLADPDHPVLTVSKDGCDSLVLNTGGVMLDGAAEVLLSGGKKFAGPGHCSAPLEVGGAMWLVYNAYDLADVSRGRTLMLDPLMWEDGWMKVRGGNCSFCSDKPVVSR